MHVRLRTVARITASADGVECADLITDTHLHGIPLEMSHEYKRAAVTQCDDNVIASEARSAFPSPFRLAQHVGQENQLGTAPSMVGLLIMGSYHPPGHRREDRHPEPQKSLGRFSSHRASPCEGCRATTFVDIDEVDCI
jgi:hypothetical protein